MSKATELLGKINEMDSESPRYIIFDMRAVNKRDKIDNPEANYMVVDQTRKGKADASVDNGEDLEELKKKYKDHEVKPY